MCNTNKKAIKKPVGILRWELHRIVKIITPAVIMIIAFLGDFIKTVFINQLYNNFMPAANLAKFRCKVSF
jgi:hypothetical protein